MTDLNIKSTKYTPQILFDSSTNTLIIKGESYPENTFEFYRPCFEWLNAYFELPESPLLVINVELIYFNSSSSKILFNLFDLLDATAKKGNKVSVNWIYDEEDEDYLEFGEEFAEDLAHVPFNLVPQKPSE